MAESTESKSIKELTKAVKESNEKRQAQLERIAASTDHEGTTRAADAREQLKKEEESLAPLIGVFIKAFSTLFPSASKYPYPSSSPNL